MKGSKAKVSPPVIKKMNSMKALIGQNISVGSYTVNIKEKIGEGGYAWVFLAEDSQRMQYALKYVKVAELSRFRQFSKEAEFLKSLPPHPHIVHLFASEVNERDLSILFLFEYAPSSIISLLSERSLTQSELLIIFHALCDAVSFLHSQSPPIIHRDIKPENILIAQDGVPKLCDFGSATRSVAYPTMENMMIVEADINENTTANYRSPEMLDLYGGKPIGPPADVWALGCTLYKMIAKEEMFKAEDKLAILQGRVSVPPGCNQAFENTIRACLQVDPSRRPTAAQIAASVLKARGSQDRIEVPVKSKSKAPERKSEDLNIFGFVKEAYRSFTASGSEKIMIKATYGNDKPPKAKHVRRLLLSSIKDPSATRIIIDYLLTTRPWDTDPRIAAKVLYVILTILQYKKDLSTLVPITIKTDAIVNKYANTKLGDSFRSSLVAVKQLGSVIRVKLMLHAAHPEIEGNFANNGHADSHLAEDIKHYILTMCQAGNAMLDGIGSMDSFVTEVLVLPIINEVAAVGSLLRLIDPTSKELATARQVIGRASQTDYLASSVSSSIDTIPRSRF